ncbi:MAG: hypothetical protein FWD22_03340 [Treponema sp.]|nr:hypothetical protein [Treponema sp.]
MDDNENIRDIPSTSSLSKLGITALGYIAGGVFLFLLNVIARFKVFGLIVGVLVCLVGIGSLFSRNPADRKAGIIITAAGALVVLSKTGIPGIAIISGVLLTIGAIGLIVLGIFNAVKFFIGLKKRL